MQTSFCHSFLKYSGRSIAVAFLFLLCVLLLAGCYSLEQQPSCYLTIHQYVQENERIIESDGIAYTHDLASGKRIPIRTIPLLSSRLFYDAEVLPDKSNPEKAGLRLFLSPIGVNRWRQARSYHTCDLIVLCMDGFFVKAVNMTQLIDPEGDEKTIVLPALWSTAQAKRIAEHAQGNFKVFPH